MYNARPVAPGGSSPHFAEALSGCLLRLSPRRRPALVGCSFPRPEPPATCLLSLPSQRPHSPRAPSRTPPRSVKVCRPRWAVPLRNEVPVWYVQAGDSGVGGFWHLYQSFFFFIKDPFHCYLSKIKVHLHVNTSTGRF